MSEITDKLKALGEKWANLPECRESNEIADEVMDKLPEVLEQIEQLERSCAEMKDVLLEINHRRYLLAPGHSKELIDFVRSVNRALSTSCGRDYIHRDEVRPLVDALRFYSDISTYLPALGEGMIPVMIDGGDCAKQAFAHAERLKGEK